MQPLVQRLRHIVATATPQAFRTIGWIIRLTVLVSFIVFLMQYTGLIQWISAWVSPVFHLFGLRGDAAMAFVSGYFINIYSSIAVISTLDLTVREITILATMSTAAHAIIVEGAVLHKTGTPTLYTITLRTLASLALGLVLNWVLPDRPDFVAASATAPSTVPLFQLQGDFLPLFGKLSDDLPDSRDQLPRVFALAGVRCEIWRQAVEERLYFDFFTQADLILDFLIIFFIFYDFFVIFRFINFFSFFILDNGN